jgi:hypothetical protein
MHVGHVALRVPDVGLTADHAAAALGLFETERTDSIALLTANSKHHELQITQGPNSGMDHIGLEVGGSDELALVRQEALRHGGRLISEEVEEPGLTEAFRVEGPANVVFEIYTPMSVDRFAIKHQIGRNARKLGHMTMFSDEPGPLVDFITEGLGFRVSDRAAGVTWMRCDTDHHGLAVAPRESGTVLHHYAFEIDGWDGIRRYLDELAVRGQKIVYGPGRHGPGFNLYTYLPEPNGACIEGYADLLRIEDESTYEPIDWDDIPGHLNLWGPDVPDGFVGLGMPTLSSSR